VSPPTDRGAVLVTGASSGIGRACAYRLDQAGFRVFGAVLPDERIDDVQRDLSTRFTPLALDITDATSIESVHARLCGTLAREGLVGLVNNAGVCVSAPLEVVAMSALRHQFEVNVLGHIAVTQSVLPLLRRRHGRIVMMGSALADLPLPMTGPYAASKSALKTMTDVLRMELSPWNISVSLIVPSGVATPMWQRAARTRDAMVRDLSPETRALYGLSASAEGSTEDDVSDPRAARRMSPDHVAAAVMHALTSPSPRPEYVVGRNARLLKIATALPLVDRLLELWLMRAVRLRGHTL
jgi:NAD(P)-dependent dehydrogenase (short-subunit alcohol dehydrogenase family)